MPALRTGARYVTNLYSMVATDQGPVPAARATGRFMVGELAMLPRLARHRLAEGGAGTNGFKPTRYSDDVRHALGNLGVELRPYRIDVEAFNDHVEANDYPRNYAAGPVDEGGAREKKLMEYFVSLDLLQLRADDVVMDVASEYSVFPQVVRRLVGATCYRQDLIYPPGIDGDRIGGSADAMGIPDAFADKIVLHNAFEHFEGTADSGFVTEAARVLRPGGLVCIVPLFVCDRYCILTDPLVSRKGVEWDEDADVVEELWHHNRFGRFYDPAALERRVLEPAAAAGLEAVLYHFENVTDVHPRASMHFGLVLRKPE
jgi:SAM-dependent methyltransferase